MKSFSQRLQRFKFHWTKGLVIAGILCGTGTFAKPTLADPSHWADDVRIAQTEGRWDDVILLYQDQLKRTPDRGDLWVKMADIENDRGNLQAVRPILEKAVVMAPGDAGLHARLSQQYALTNQPRQALAEIEQAVKLAPDNTSYLKSRAQLANWLGLYQIAGDSYARLLALTPQGSTYGLMLARSRTWEGNLDAAAKAYHDYLQAHPEDAEALLEYARVQGWRGNLAGAIELLALYEERFPQNAKPDADRARLLAWAGKTHEASRINDELLVQKPNDYELNVTRTVALDKGNRKEEAVESLNTLTNLRPDSAEVTEIKRHVNTPLRPDIALYGRYYNDGDHLSIAQESLRGGYSISPATRLGLVDEMWQLSANPGSGLENQNGSRHVDYQKASLTVASYLTPTLWVNAAAGPAQVNGEGAIFAYDVLLGARPDDSLSVSLEQSHDNLLISPRSASLGLRHDTTQLNAEWTPGLDYTIVGLFRYDDISDGNTRWEAVLAPRRSVIRSQLLDLDLGLRGQMFGFDQDLNSGYYDPGFYEQYALTAFSYWKFGPESGLSLTGAAGYYRDDIMNHFDFGWSTDAELILGVHSDWSAKLAGHFMQNFRQSGGAYHAAAVEAAIIRRF